MPLVPVQARAVFSIVVVAGVVRGRRAGVGVGVGAGADEGRSMSRAVMVVSREGGSHPGKAEAEEDPSGSEEESSESEQEELGPSTVIRVGPPHGKQRPSEVTRGKRQASLPPEAGPSKRLWGDASMAGPPGIHIFLPTSARPQPTPQETMEQSLLVSTVELRRQLQEVYVQSRRQQDELATTAMDWDRAWWDWDVALAAVREWESELGALQAQVAELELRMARETPGEGHAVVAAWMAEREAVCRRDWALLEAASSQGRGSCVSVPLAVSRLANSQCRLGPGAPVAPGWCVGRMPFNLPAELDIGLAQLDILLAGHWQRNTIASGSWLDMAVDTGERLLVREEHLAALATQMETAMLVTGPPAESQEGADEEGD
ncbi:hypothetical protein C0993_007781 [Termitomyces sp. T159_Od127]|nr:hypothetical protein C0993_007781 [Termitomyces sp. T159_Od127]